MGSRRARKRRSLRSSRANTTPFARSSLTTASTPSARRLRWRRASASVRQPPIEQRARRVLRRGGRGWAVLWPALTLCHLSSSADGGAAPLRVLHPQAPLAPPASCKASGLHHRVQGREPRGPAWTPCRHADPFPPRAAPLAFAAGFKQLIKDARLELKVYDINQMSRLFNLKGGAKVETCMPAARTYTPRRHALTNARACRTRARARHVATRRYPCGREGVCAGSPASVMWGGRRWRRSPLPAGRAGTT